MSNEILFKHAEDGVIDACVKNTTLPYIWEIAAVDISTIRHVSGNTITYTCPTDKEGLERLIDRGQDFIENVNSANQAISLVMTEHEKIDCIDVTELAWLQVGLLELSAKVDYAIHQMQHVLKTKKPD